MDNIEQIEKLAALYESKFIKTAGAVGLYCSPALRNSGLAAKINQEIATLASKAVDGGGVVASTLKIDVVKDAVFKVAVTIIFKDNSLLNDSKIGAGVKGALIRFQQNCTRVCVNALNKMDPTEKEKFPAQQSEELYWNADASDFLNVSV